MMPLFRIPAVGPLALALLSPVLSHAVGPIVHRTPAWDLWMAAGSSSNKVKIYILPSP